MSKPKQVTAKLQSFLAWRADDARLVENPFGARNLAGMRLPRATKPLCSIARFALLVVLASTSRNSAAPQHEQTPGEQKGSVFSVETNLVTLDVTVTDKRGRPLDRLKKEDFRVFEAGAEQNIAFFSHENRPASWGIVLDRSGSMAGTMDEVYNAALHSIEAGTRDDDIFVIAFNESVDIIQDFTSDRRRLLESTRNIIAGGSTALYDAVALAVDHIKRGRHQKKVLVVVTDGEDNASRFTFARLLDMVKETEILIYTVGIFESMNLPVLRILQGRTRDDLKRLAEETGGLAYFPRNMKECDQACRDIARRVSRQYSLGYYPSKTNWDGSWRELRVELARPEQLTIGARRGYFARGEPERLPQ